MTINKVSLILVQDNQLLDAITMASLDISLSSAGVTQIHEIPGPEVGVVATKAMAIRAMVMCVIVVYQPKQETIVSGLNCICSVVCLSFATARVASRQLLSVVLDCRIVDCM